MKWIIDLPVDVQEEIRNDALEILTEVGYTGEELEETLHSGIS